MVTKTTQTERYKLNLQCKKSGQDTETQETSKRGLQKNAVS